jgi:Holliday junction resolvasome RuvABC endonuclease subunit
VTLPILGIDPALTCGWALRWPDGRFESGIWKLKGDRFEGGGLPLVRLRAKLRELLALQPVERVVIERTPGAAVARHAAFWSHAILGSVMATCEELSVPYGAINSASVKAFAVGKANAKKDLVTAAAARKWPGHVFQTADESDARWIAEAAAAGRG